MATTILHNARQVLTCAGKGPKKGAYMRDIGMLLNASVVVEDGKIKEVGPAPNIKAKYQADIDKGDCEFIDMTGHVVLPGFVDPHTHCLFVGTREDEFEMRIEGKTYVDILLGGGGILNTVNKVRKADEEDLIEETLPRLARMLAHGTTTVEIKSGYGLDIENEMKMLNAIGQLESKQPVEVVPTFMGAHAIPPEYTKDVDAFTTHVVDEMMPKIAEKCTTKFCDIFTEKKVFPYEQTERVMKKAKELGFTPKIHADEIDPIGGVDLAVKYGAISAEHLIKTTDEGIDTLAKSDVIACLLPGTAYSLMHGVYARARTMIDKGVAVALATDCNPGSCYTESLQIVISIACTQMGMLAAEAITACTLNAAHAIGVADKVGSIEEGKQADIIAMAIPDYKYIPYHFGVNHVNFVMKKGEVVIGNNAS